MKPLPRTKSYLILSLVLLIQAFGLLRIPAPPIELRKATQTEINNGAKVNAYVDPYGLNHWTGGGGGPTNGQTQAQVSANVAGSAVLQTNGVGTNTTLGTLTQLNGKVKVFHLASGTTLTTNTIAPFNWTLDATNGSWSKGTGSVTQISIDSDGNISFPGASIGVAGDGNFNSLSVQGSASVLDSGGTASFGHGGFTVDSSGNAVAALRLEVDGPQTNAGPLSVKLAQTNYALIYWKAYAAQSGKTNIVFFNSAGQGFTNDLTTFIASLPSGGGGSVPNGLVTNNGTVDVGISGDGTFYSTYGRFAQLLLTNSTMASQPIIRFNSETNSQGEAALEIEASTNGNSSPLTLRSATGLKIVADTLTATTANFSQANAATLWATNALTPTNAFVGTVVDFNQGFGATNLGGGLTFTDVANVTAGAVNTAIRRLYANGADRTIAFPASWHTNYNFIGVVTNGWQMDLLITVTGARTNVAQILYP